MKKCTSNAHSPLPLRQCLLLFTEELGRTNRRWAFLYNRTAPLIVYYHFRFRKRMEQSKYKINIKIIKRTKIHYDQNNMTFPSAKTIMFEINCQIIILEKSAGFQAIQKCSSDEREQHMVSFLSICCISDLLLVLRARCAHSRW